MKIRPLHQDDIPAVIELMALGEPYIRPRTASDYWLYANLFSATCLIAIVDDNVVGAIMAFRSQDNPDDLYLQDVITHPGQRRTNVFTKLFNAVRDQAVSLGCRRLYLTSEPDNAPAHATWTKMGFANLAGDQIVNGVSVISDFKGPGKDRAVYELRLGSLDNR